MATADSSGDDDDDLEIISVVPAAKPSNGISPHERRAPRNDRLLNIAGHKRSRNDEDNDRNTEIARKRQRTPTEDDRDQSIMLSSDDGDDDRDEEDRRIQPRLRAKPDRQHLQLSYFQIISTTTYNKHVRPSLRALCPQQEHYERGQ